jgi:chemotaxis family two-component system sensor histidine kinase/response regulator PixL
MRGRNGGTDGFHASRLATLPPPFLASPQFLSDVVPTFSFILTIPVALHFKLAMADDKELQIRLQFLDEAQEYLETLESQLLGIAQGIDSARINETLRAAHSVKGGAALMGLETLSVLAHRLEDALKVLKIQRQTVELDATLESQLLAAVDRMGQVMRHHRQQLSNADPTLSAIDPGWLQENVYPIFDGLRERLGEPTEEDAHSLLTPEEDQAILPLIFQGEVEGCLERLAGVLEEASPCLREEVQIMAQELAGLGEMLQLSPFTQLCQAIGTQMQTITEEQLIPTAQAALDTWRQVQALVLAGELDAIPTSFTGSPDAPLPPLSAEQIHQAAVAWQSDAESPLEVDSAALDVAATDFQLPDFTQIGQQSLTDTSDFDDDFYFETEQPAATDDSLGALFGVEEPSPAGTASPAETKAEAGGTVRVPVQQINQLSDLFGELIIERNRLDVEVRRLRSLLTTMQTRMRTLDSVNSDLRSAYDRVATQRHSHRLSGTTSEAAMNPPATPGFDVLELDRYGDVHVPFREIIETIVQLQEVGDDIDLSLDSTEQTTRGLRKTSRQLQKYLTQLRMRPLADIFNRFPRALREMSLQYDKPVELQVKGESTLVDRHVLEALQDPLMHILRNCFDHGIEEANTRQQRGKPATGTITLSARQQNSRTVITIQDDGGGIPLEQIRERAIAMGLDSTLVAAASQQDLLSLIFEPGFSTAREVTSLSGRGVGMDVVRSKLKEIRGEIQVDTEAGRGTTFTLSIPYTLSVTRVLIVESRGLRMAFPIDAVEEMFSLAAEHVLSTAGKDSFEWHGELVQLVRLADWLHFHCPVSLESPDIMPAIAAPTVLLVPYNQRLVGIQVERCWGEQEVALRRVVGNLPMPVGFNSCTILGDGQVVPLVAVPELLYWIASCEANGESPAVDPILPTYLPVGSDPDSAAPASRKPTVLLVDDSINVRRFIALTLEKAGYQVAQAKDGQDALDKLTAGLAVEAIICDVEMPRLDGYGFLSQLKAQAQHQHVPVAMLTSRSSPKHRQMAMKLGAAAYFTKPYNEQTLLQTLEDLIAPALVS